MMNFQNPLFQSLLNYKPIPMAPQDQQANNALIAKLIIQNRLLAMKNASLQQPKYYKFNEVPEKKIKTDDMHLNLLMNQAAELSSTAYDESISTASLLSPQRSPTLIIPRNISSNQSKPTPKPLQLQPINLNKAINKSSIQFPDPIYQKEAHQSSPILRKTNEVSEEVNRKRLRCEIEEPEKTLGESKNQELEENLTEAKKNDEFEIKTLMEQYNSMIAEKKRLRKIKRKEAAPPKKGRLRKLVDPETVEEEVKVEETHVSEIKDLSQEEENQF